jgi:uncharacterized protein GlcG (DUF336 family)
MRRRSKGALKGKKMNPVFGKMYRGSRRLALALVCAASSASAASAALPTQKVLPIELAMEAAKVALAQCQSQGFNVAVAVLDREGGLRLLALSPGVTPLSAELSQRKARSAVMFRTSSAEIGARMTANPGFAKAMSDVEPKMSAAQGAVPIKAGTEFLGAMGISGAPGGDKDEACALAGLKAIADRLN